MKNQSSGMNFQEEDTSWLRYSHVNNNLVVVYSVSVGVRLAASKTNLISSTNNFA